MNNPAQNRKSSRHSKSVKRSQRLDAQLAETVTTPASAIEINPASAFPPVDKIRSVDAETTEPVEIVPELQLRKVERADRKMLGKVKRAFFKAGVEAGPESQAAFLNDLLMANVPVLNRSSGRIARVVKGEQSIASLLLVRVPKKSA
jgi:hypothetical protein